MIYLSGKITDPDREVMKANLLRFFEKAKEFKEPVFNPADLETEGFTWEDYLVRDLLFIYNNRPKIYFMDGWESSRGARLEHTLAEYLGLEMEYEQAPITDAVVEVEI
jgi:hypothetical protein